MRRFDARYAPLKIEYTGRRGCLDTYFERNFMYVLYLPSCDQLWYGLNIRISWSLIYSLDVSDSILSLRGEKNMSCFCSPCLSEKYNSLGFDLDNWILLEWIFIETNENSWKTFATTAVCMELIGEKLIYWVYSVSDCFSP